MIKRFPLLFFLFCLGGCGAFDETGTLQVTVQSSNSSESASPPSDVISLATTKVSPSTFTVTITDAAGATHSKSATFAASSSISFDSIAVGTGTLDLTATSSTSNGVSDGYIVEGRSITIASGDNTVAVSPKFLNFLTNDSSQYTRLQAPTNQQIRIDCGDGTTLSAAQKINFECIIELDSAGTRSTSTVLNANNSNGLNASTGPYFHITGGTTRPKCFYYNSSGTQTMRSLGAWPTDEGATVARCTFGVRQIKEIIESDRKGGLRALFRKTSGGSWTAIPESGFSTFDLSGGGDTDITSLIANGASCVTSRNGETCTSGRCISTSVCDAVAGDAIGSSVSTLAGSGSNGFATGSATTATFASPNAIFNSADGNSTYVVDPGYNHIRKIDHTVATTNSSYVTNFCGNPSGAGALTNGACSGAAFNAPWGITGDSSGTYLYVTETGNDTIRQIDIAAATVATFVSGLNDPQGIDIDSANENLYVTNNGANTITKVVIATAATSTLVAASAGFNGPGDMAIDSTDTYLYALDVGNSVIVRVTVSSGAASSISTSSAFTTLRGIAIDPTDTYLYVTHDTGSQDQLLQVIISGGTVSTLTTTGTNPVGLAPVPRGNVIYYADTGGDIIRALQ